MDEIVDYQTNVATIFDRERLTKPLQVDEDEEDVLPVAEESEESLVEASTMGTSMLLDPSMFESDVDI